MKVWVKLLIGSVLGIVIGFLLPDENVNVLNIMAWIEKFAIRLGRYAVIPVLVFSLTITVYELRADRKFWPMVFKNIIVIIIASVFVISAGILITILFYHGRIPIEKVEQTEILSLGIASNVQDIFPSNMFSVLAGEGVFLLPVCIFAFFLGLGLNYDRTFSRPLVSLIDNFSRVFYHVASFFSEILGFILIFLCAYWAVRFNTVLKLGVYKDLIVLLAVFSIVLCFGVMPLFLYFLRPKVNPWLILYGSLGPAMASFFSQDINFTIPLLQCHLKENFGIRRRSGSLSIAVFSTFCRCGSAIAAAIAFIVIIKAYTSLSISAAGIISIGLRTLVISFLLARHPGEGAYIALAVLCLGYGNGEYKTGYLILKPLAFYIVAIGTFIDIMVHSYCSFIIAKANGFIEEKNLVRFI